MKNSDQSASTIDVVLAPLDLEADSRERYLSVLSGDERRRAARYHHDADRWRFIVSRGVLRTLLAQRLHCSPEMVRFDYGRNDKPAIEGNPDNIQFNVSHSHGFGLFALTHQCEIGVDLEKVRGGFAETSIPEQFFSERECAGIRELPAEAQPLAFFHCWTRKEAFVKANGQGLSFGLNEFDVSVDPSHPPALLAIRGDAEEAARWSMFSLTPVAGFVAAVALPDRGYALNFEAYSHP